jgi:hypothetical protein
MTQPRTNRPVRQRRPPPTIRPSQVVVAAVVLAVFVTGLVIGGAAGALIVGVLAIAAGVWLVLRWAALDVRTRTFRAVIVLIGLAVAASLLAR